MRDTTGSVYARIFCGIRSTTSAINRVIINNPCENPHGRTQRR